MGSKYTKRYTEEFKRDAIALVDSSGKTVARELGIGSESLRGWYRRARADRGEGTSGEFSSAEREELKRLRRKNREEQQTIEILNKGDCLLREGERPVSALYRLIHAEKVNCPTHAFRAPRQHAHTQEAAMPAPSHPASPSSHLDPKNGISLAESHLRSDAVNGR